MGGGAGDNDRQLVTNHGGNGGVAPSPGAHTVSALMESTEQ